ncbi:MAG: phosphoribosylglycinamide formyltransferase [Candidatus Omnitrophota bacterium]
MNIAVMCSGNGSNFQAIVEASKRKKFDAKIALMVCDKPKAYALKRAENENIGTVIVDIKNFANQEAYENRIIETLEEADINLICLAGYMRILLPSFVKKYKNRMLNIHPSLLPQFKGAHAIKDAIKAGVSETGVTVHFVTDELDSGPVVLQESISVKDGDTEESLAERIHKLEHRLYPEAIKLFVEDRLKVVGDKVKILPGK